MSELDAHEEQPISSQGAGTVEGTVDELAAPSAPEAGAGAEPSDDVARSASSLEGAAPAQDSGADGAPVPAPQADVAPALEGTAEPDAPAAAETAAPAPDGAVAAVVAEATVAPEAAVPSDAGVIPEGLPRPRVPWWPFLLYLGAWFVGVGIAAWAFLSAPRVATIAGEPIYPYVLRGGLALTALGPVLAIVVWFVAWVFAERGRRAGLFADALLKGAFTTLLGVVVWWVMLVAADRVRLDRLW